MAVNKGGRCLVFPSNPTKNTVGGGFIDNGKTMANILRDVIGWYRMFPQKEECKC